MLIEKQELKGRGVGAICLLFPQCPKQVPTGVRAYAACTFKRMDGGGKRERYRRGGASYSRYSWVGTLGK